MVRLLLVFEWLIPSCAVFLYVLRASVGCCSVFSVSMTRFRLRVRRPLLAATSGLSDIFCRPFADVDFLPREPPSLSTVRFARPLRFCGVDEPFSSSALSGMLRVFLTLRAGDLVWNLSPDGLREALVLL